MKAYSDYWNVIENLANESLKESRDSQVTATLEELMQQLVESNIYLVIDAYHETVLTHTRNYPDLRRVQALMPEHGDWQAMRRLTASLAMREDVQERVHALIAAEKMTLHLALTTPLVFTQELEELCQILWDKAKSNDVWKPIAFILDNAKYQTQRYLQDIEGKE